MSTFTIPLKKVITLTGGVITFEPPNTIMTGGNIGLNHYPIFEDDYKKILDGKIIDRYWNREIGMETIEMFQLAMRRKMNEIMPYYNKLYLTEKIPYEALSTIDLHTTSDADSEQVNTASGEAESVTSTESKSRSVSSETPQTMLDPNADYATSAADANGQSSGNSNSTETNEQNANTNTHSVSDVVGYQGAASSLIMQYRESLLNIDTMILADLEELFMLVWDNGDSYTNGRIPL